MRNDEDQNYISVGSWMLILFCMYIPLVGFLMILFGGFVGQNESRKNFFRAILAWVGIFVTLVVGFILLGHWPDIQKHLNAWTHKT